MALDVKFYKRDFTSPLDFPDVTLLVKGFDWHAMGGPLTATIEARGNDHALYGLLNWLRAPIEILDENGDACWWGLVEAAKVRTGRVGLGVSLQTMANKIAVAYSHLQAGMMTAGSRATTGWTSDADSVATYGTKELLGSLNNATAAAAEARRNAKLIEVKWPVPVIEIGEGEPGVVLECRGWWDTLAWRYYSCLAGLESYTDTGTGVQAFGDVAATTKLAQSCATVTGTDSWIASTIAVRMRKQGSPADNVVVDLCTDSAGAPGAVLTTASLAASEIQSDYAWTTFTLGAEVTITATTTYWIVVRRSGSLDATNYYLADGNQALGYSRGVWRIWNGSAWVARGTDADMLFKLAGVRETTTQLETLIEDVGQFFTDTEILTASGIKTSPYRDGDVLADAIALELLSSGTSGGARLLATVLRDRVLQIDDEPSSDPYSINVFMDGDAQLYDRWGTKMEAARCPVGKWCMLKDIIPPTLDVSKLADPTKFFIEQAGWDVAERRWVVMQTRGALSMWDVAGMDEG